MARNSVAASFATALRRFAMRVDPPRPRRSASFGGAAGGRLYADWQASNVSADFEIRGANAILRARARQLARDNPHAQGFLSELASNVIGPFGILLEAHVANLDKKKAKATNDAIEASFDEWGKPANATVTRRTSWKDLQRLVIRTVAMDGECFLRKIPYFGNPHNFTLQFIDPDQVDDFYNRAPGVGQNEIRMGVEIDQYGAAVAYWVWTRHLSDTGGRERVRIPAEEILHLFVAYRGQQTRGVTWFAPALTNLKMLDGYTEAELVAARASAAKMGFIVNKSEYAVENYSPPEDGEEPRISEAAPGTFEELAPGQEVEMYDPKHPSVAFRDFTKAVLRGVARGVNMAYTTLTGDLEAVNYSSIRAGLLSERDQFRTLQGWIIEQLHEPVYAAWLPLALLSNVVRVDGRLASDYRQVKWRARGWKWVDPKNDLEAAQLAIHLGLDSRTRLAAEQGLDWEEVMADLAHEREFADGLGLDISGQVTPPTAFAPETPDQRDARQAQETRPRLVATGTGD